MAERRGHPVGAFLLVLVTLVPGGGLGDWRADRVGRGAASRSRPTMGEGGKQGHPVAAVLVGMVTVLVTFGLGLAAFWVYFAAYPLWGDPLPPSPNRRLGVLLAVLAALVLVGGLWGALRLGTGSWDLRPRPAARSPGEPPGPGA